MTSALRESDLVIRACILYEVLDKKPIQESYDNFCRKVGNDVMEYTEFDFWYYRFYNGNHDLHYDRSSDPIMYSLSEMPVHMIDKIIKQVDIINSLSLLKVSAKMQTIVQDSKFPIDFMRVHLYDEESAKIIINDNFSILYQKEENGSIVSYFGSGEYFDEPIEKTMFFANKNPVKMFNKDLKLIVEKRTIALSSFQILYEKSEEESCEKYMSGIRKTLKFATSITSTTVKAEGLAFPDLARLVDLFPSGTLEEIDISTLMSTEYEGIICLEQWKMARKLVGVWQLSVPIDHFLHADCFEVEFANFTKNDAKKIRDMMDKRTNFGNALIRSKEMNIIDMKDVFDANDANFIYENPEKYLAAQSFKALLLGSFAEGKSSEVTLTGVDPNDFHFFLEVLYGDSAINDLTVEGILHIADMYDTPMVVRKCEEFLIKGSKLPTKKKLQMAFRYKMENFMRNYYAELGN